MNKSLSVTILIFVLAFFMTGMAMAQSEEYGTEVCVNASLADEAKRVFPNASVHVLPDFNIRPMNGWRIVRGSVRADGRIHTDEQETQIRRLIVFLGILRSSS